jgi:hypothetical protein
MRVLIAVAVGALLVGCVGSPRGVGHPDVERAISLSSQGDPGKADTLHALQNAGIMKTPGDVTKVSTFLDMSCPFVNYPGATSFSPERMQEQLAQSWHLDVTTEQATRLQDAQRSFCA